MATKVCSKCGVEKAVGEFSSQKQGKGGLTAACKKCNTRLQKEYYRNNPEARARKRERTRLNRYGITKEELAAISLSQGNACAICNKECNRKGKLSIDHDHETGEVRGLLCDACNVGIGKFGDSFDRIKAAYDYLLRFETGGVE